MRFSNNDPDWRARLSCRLTVAFLVLATAASVMGLLFGEGLYSGETESIRAQVFGQDLMILVFAIPVLVWSVVSATRGSVRGRLAWTALLFFFVYTYLSYVMLFAFNRAFLLHVALTAMALYALVLNLAGLDVSSVDVDTSRRIMRYTPHVLGFLLVMILLLWLPEIISSTVTGDAPPRLVDDGTRTHVIAALDLILIVPLGLLIIDLVRKGERTGFVLAPILYIKGVTLAVSVLGMIAFMALAGTPPALPEVGMFVLLSAVFMCATILYLGCLSKAEMTDVHEGVVERADIVMTPTTSPRNRQQTQTKEVGGSHVQE